MEEYMSLQGYRPQSEYFRRFFEEGVRAGREEGLEEGLQEGRQEGRKEILLMAIEALMEVLGIELSAEQRVTLQSAGVERLEEVHEALRTSRQWPSEPHAESGADRVP
jgi:predicted transposase YdaD